VGSRGLVEVDQHRVCGLAVAVSNHLAGDVQEGLQGEFRDRRGQRPGCVEDVVLPPAQVPGEVRHAAVGGDQGRDVEDFGGVCYARVVVGAVRFPLGVSKRVDARAERAPGWFGPADQWEPACYRVGVHG
jgi:hypothetical protein